MEVPGGASRIPGLDELVIRVRANATTAPLLNAPSGTQTDAAPSHGKRYPFRGPAVSASGRRMSSAGGEAERGDDP
jgi:hypothetical protein